MSQPALSLDNDPAASFVLALRQGHHLSQSALSRVIEHTEVLLQDALSQIESNVVGVLSAKGIDFSADMAEIVQKCYPSFDNVCKEFWPFSKFKLFKYYKRYYPLISIGA